MKSIALATAALWAATQVLADSATQTSTGVEEPSAAPQLNTPIVQGCFSSVGSLVFNSNNTFNSKSLCATDICAPMGMAVAGTTGGKECFCGNEYPSKSSLANDTDCDYPCPGYPFQACGGDGFWTIYNTGVSLEVNFADDSASTTTSSSSSAPTATQPSVVTISGSTVFVTPTSAAESSAPPSTNSSTNVAGVAVGVVVGIVALAGIVGAIFFVLRRRRNQELEEEHRRNAAVNAFITGSKPPGSSGGVSLTDARLDPVMAQRRLSDGSIADNQDYSRRILRVTNA